MVDERQRFALATLRTDGFGGFEGVALAPDGLLIVRGDFREQVVLPGGATLPAGASSSANFPAKVPVPQ